jgi:hypothetical protein
MLQHNTIHESYICTAALISCSSVLPIIRILSLDDHVAHNDRSIDGTRHHELEHTFFDIIIMMIDGQMSGLQLQLQ